MEHFHLFDCQFDAEQLFLGGHCCLQGKEVLEKLFKEDFRNPRALLLVHPKKSFAYYHEYVKSPQNKTYIIRVYNQRILKRAAAHFCTKLKLDHPYLLVIVDLTGEHPRFMIEKCEYVAESAEEVAQVLTHSLNFVLKGVGWKMKMKSREMRDDSVPLLLRTTIENCLRMPRTLEELYGKDAIDIIMPKVKKEKKNTSDFRDVIIKKEKVEPMMVMLHRMIEGKTTPKETIKPIMAAIVANAIRRPTWPEFVAAFPHAICSKSSFERLTSLINNPYKDCKSFCELVETFKSL